MYYYEKYNPTVMLLAIAVFTIAAIFLVRKRISSLIDPLNFHILWCASGLALLTGYFWSVGINVDGFLFVVVYIAYIVGLSLFLGKPDNDVTGLQRELDDPRNTKLFLVCLALNVVSRYEFITYAITSPSLVEWFLYRFKQIEGRSIPQYILQLGARPFFLYYLFMLLKTQRKWRVYLIAVLLVNVFLDIVAGGRSSVISLLLAYGFFVYRFSPLFPQQTLKRLNIYGAVAVGLALTVGATVTSYYRPDSSFEEGILSIANRLLAAGDGLEMYLANNASAYIPTGLNEYVKSVFGIFIKRVVDVQTQSIGWRLYELENGIEVPFAVGPNYILPLQAFVLEKYLAIPYALFISFWVAFLRGNAFSRRFISSRPLIFILGLLSFEPALDLELFILTLSGCLFVYFVILLPVRRFRFVADWRYTLNLTKQVSTYEKG
ncbi:oligosaccharide repeat unit polymerase [Fibrella sp. WM1]|uniref:oligosaccharide repeat unit polymerase n=1 Tax=Fibrella musci TaxID=3242485 RepID=UPI003522A6F8